MWISVVPPNSVNVRSRNAPRTIGSIKLQAVVISPPMKIRAGSSELMIDASPSPR
jgi:hypothetical protein